MAIDKRGARALLGLVKADLDILGIVIHGPSDPRLAEDEHRVLPHVQGQAPEAVLLLEPAGALADLVREERGPLALRQVELDTPRLLEHRRGEQAVADHELAVEVPRRRVVGELETGGPQRERPAALGGGEALRVEVGHEAGLERGPAGEGARAALLGGVVAVDGPGHAVGAAAVQAAVRAQQAEGDPALVDPGRRRPLEAADVVGPEGEPAQAQAEAAAHRLRHGLGRRLAVAAPYEWEALRARARRAREEDCLGWAVARLEGLVDDLVVEEGVIILPVCVSDSAVEDRVCG